MKSSFCFASVVVTLFGPFTSGAQPSKNDRTLPTPVVHDSVQKVENSAFAKLDRKIAKEPAYKNAPKYCLVLFGAEAGTRVWLVVDGDTLYADGNGNGDLTEQGEDFKTQVAPLGPSWLIGDIIEAQTKLKHTKFTVHLLNGDMYRLSVEAGYERSKVRSLSGFAHVRFGSKPANAPIVHFAGPLTMGLSMAYIGDRPAFLCADVGTPGLGEGSFVNYTHSIMYGVGPKLRPELELEYAGENNAVIREKARFYKDNFEKAYLYPVHSGEKGDGRQVKITLSFHELWAINVAPRSFTRRLVTLQK